MTMSQAIGIALLARLAILLFLVLTALGIAFYAYKKRHQLKIFLQNYFIHLFLGLLVIATATFALNYIADTQEKEEYEEKYIDFNEWEEGRLCSELRFQCLPESQDKAIIDTPLENGLDSFELTEEVEQKIADIVAKGEKNYMLVSDFEADFFDKVEEKRFLKEMERDLEKEFPGFWKDTPKAVRYRWIQHAMYKAKKLGYKSKKPNGIIELCARIGLNFDNDPKYKEIKKFITSPNAVRRGYVFSACNYIDYTIFNKTHDKFGTEYTDWYFREISGYLPEPKRPLPKLND